MMKIPAKIDYACKALFVLSKHWPNPNPVQIQDIAKKQRIPIKFLVHILIQLKQLGYVESLRGKNGGYVLLQAPELIRLSDVIKRMGGFGCFMEPKKHKKKVDVFHQIWDELDCAVLEVLDKISFETICSRDTDESLSLVYEI